MIAAVVFEESTPELVLIRELLLTPLGVPPPLSMAVNVGARDAVGAALPELLGEPLPVTLGEVLGVG